MQNERLQKLRAYMEREHLDVSILLEPDNQYYVTRFKAITYSRPIATVVTLSSLELIVPSLEEVHARSEANVDRLSVYYEIPEMANRGIRYTDRLDELFATLPPSAAVGVEKAFAPLAFAEYLQEKGLRLGDVGDYLSRARYVKDAEELRRIKTAGFLSDIGIKGSLESACPGMNELELETAGDRPMQTYITEHYPSTYVDFENWTNSGIDRTVMPHLFSSSRLLQAGDVIIHSRQVWFEGYRAENERTFFLGRPTDRQLDIFKVAIEAQQAGLDVIRAGIPAREVDEASRKVYKKAGLELWANHRIGHGLGLSEHEEPYLRFDNELILEAGMVFSMEPGVYVPGIGGFRHSDTVIVEETGACIPTTYPRRAEDLIFPV